MHIMVIGEVGVGKSTCIRKLLAHVDTPVFGFRTLKVDEPGGEGANVYIHPAAGPDTHGEENTVARLGPEGMQAMPAVFETMGVSLLTNIPQGAVVLMDEIGHLESSAPGFCDAVLAVLNGAYHVIAAVKTRDTPFLQQVRSCPGAIKVMITPENRDMLYGQIVAELAEKDPLSPFLPK